MPVNLKGSKVQMLSGDTQKTAKAAEEQARLDELAADPARGGKIDEKTQREAEIGLELEKSGKLTPRITRDPTGRAEFIDGNGTKWDIKSFDSRYPPRKGGFSLQRDMVKIRKELDKGENVILNSENLSAQHVQELKGAVDALEPALKSRIMWFP
ncbi:hypothetical protein JQX13_43295 [Archangium violaceum]|uniref:hypothetical protein n=1 Tax=Archangium violaceum TaxID=83451 RepID=UPI00193C1652|nr:hypothetical protein [Archangium violaceum]QRK06820.1 hypothetical protein JQX13_43295 [Archangium violaceum]